MDEPETLMPEREIGPRRFTVVITEWAESIVHKQEYQKVSMGEDGRDQFGYKTIAKREHREREIFRGEFVQRPKVSDIARLMEAES